MIEIITGEKFFGVNHNPLDILVDQIMNADPSKMSITKQEALSGLARSPQGEINARLNCGRWIVDCPTKGCAAAYYVWDKKSIIYCFYCGCPENDGRPYNVSFPSERSEIEALVKIRPLRHQANWTPGETIIDLEQENIEHGVE